MMVLTEGSNKRLQWFVYGRFEVRFVVNAHLTAGRTQ